MIRRAEPEETSMVRDSLNAVHGGLFDRFLSGKKLGVCGNTVVLVDPAVLHLPEELRAGAEMGGLPVGRIDDDGFSLDLQGAIILARETRKQTIVVKEKAARLFLYGRNILGDSITSFDSSLHPGHHCIVTNPRHEALGIGMVVGRFKGGGEAVHPIHDLGSYLRDE